MARILPLVVGMDANATTTPMLPASSGSESQSYLAAILDPFHDAWLASRARFQLLAVLGRDAAEIGVEAFHGSVVLVGDVPSAGVRDGAESTVQGITGVVGVSNQIRVRGAQCRRRGATDIDIGSTLQSRFAEARSLRGSRIDIDVYNGVVNLGGTARSSKARMAAFELALRVPGVRRVVNDIALQPHVSLNTHADVGQNANAA